MRVTNSCSSSRIWNQLPASRTKSSFTPTRNIPLEAGSGVVMALLGNCCRSRFVNACERVLESIDWPIQVFMWNVNGPIQSRKVLIVSEL